MRPLVLVTLLGVLALSTAGVANSRSQGPWKDLGNVDITIKGSGSVTLSWGFFGRKVLGCAGPTCLYAGAGFHRRQVVLTAKPYKGWKVARWQGACMNRKSKCAIDFSHRHLNRRGFYQAGVTVSFIPVGPGLTRGKPIRIGHAANLQNGWRLRINSFTPNVQLSPPPAAGSEYVAANMTVAYTDVGHGYISDLADRLELIGSHKAAYRPGDCPGDAPPPALNSPVPSGLLYSGQSATGNVCWQVATNDASILELRIDPKFSFPGLWFALH